MGVLSKAHRGREERERGEKDGRKKKRGEGREENRHAFKVYHL